MKAEPQVPRLEITSVVQHGHIYEVIGSAEAGSSVMINGQDVPTLSDRFSYFVGPLPDGAIVTVTAQNRYGGVSTKQLAVTSDIR